MKRTFYTKVDKEELEKNKELQKMVEDGQAFVVPAMEMDVPEPGDFDKIVEYAKKMLQKQKKLTMQFMLDFKRDKAFKQMVILARFDNEEQKEGNIHFLRKMVADLDCDQYFQISEAWMSNPNKGEIPSLAPKYDKQRKEILMVQMYRRDRKNRSTCIPFERKGNKFIFGTPIEEQYKSNDDPNEIVSFSRWDAYLEYEGIEERQAKDEKKVNAAFFERLYKEVEIKFKKRFMDAKTPEELKQLEKEIGDYLLAEKKKVDDRILSKEDAENEK